MEEMGAVGWGELAESWKWAELSCFPSNWGRLEIWGLSFLSNSPNSSYPNSGENRSYKTSDALKMFKSALFTSVFLLLASYVSTSPIMVTKSGSGSVIVNQDHERLNLKGLVEEKIGDSVDGEHVFFLLPARSKDLDGVTAMAPKLQAVKAAMEDRNNIAEIKNYVFGGVDSEKLKNLLGGSASVEVVNGLKNFREGLIQEGKVLVVQLEAGESAKKVDKVVSNTMKGGSGRTVYLASQPTDSELNQRRTERRLANQANGSDSTYYVAMTPNILAGILFGFLFVFVTIIGMTCMNDIEGQTIFVDRMPHVGKEF